MPQTSAAGHGDPTSNSRCHLISSHWGRFTFFELIVATCCLFVATLIAPCGKTDNVSYVDFCKFFDVVADGSRSVNLTATQRHVFEGGSFLLECIPVGFQLQRMDVTRWFFGSESTLILTGELYAIYGPNMQYLSGSADLHGSYMCEQDGVKSNVFNVSLIEGK